MKTMRFISVAVFGFLVFSGFAFAASNPAREQFQQQRSQATKALQADREAFQKNMQAKKEAVAKDIEAKRAVLKTQIAKIKDQAKQKTLQRVYESMNDLNKRNADQLQKSLNQIADVLDRVKSRTDKAQANGVDVSQVRSAITSAETAIATARAAVSVQAGKVYTFQVGSVATLKNDVGEARKTIHADLVKVRGLVKAARGAVQQAATTLGKIQGVDNLKEPANQ